MENLILFAIGTTILIFSGDLLVKAAISASIKLKISPAVVGLTVIAFGTSAPELVVALQASFSGSPGLALGNIIGSNIANIFLVLGIPALIIPVTTEARTLKVSYIYMLVATLFFISLLSYGALQFWHGAIFIFFKIIIILKSIRDDTEPAKNLKKPRTSSDIEMLDYKKVAIFFVLGLIGLPVGANLLIAGAVGIAQNFEVSEEVIGLTVVAVGTSLPELATAISTAFRKRVDLLLGNVIGSNLFNILAIAGASSLVTPMQLANNLELTSLIILFLSAISIAPFIYSRLKIGKLVGIVFLSIYMIYVVNLV